MDKYKNKKIAVLGYKLEGQSLVNFFIEKNVDSITIIDENPCILIDQHINPKINLINAKFIDVDLNSFDIIFHSPGVNPQNLQIDANKLSTLTNLFFEEKKGKVIAVSGTKGKSTTVMLLKSILKNNGFDVFVAGNIGESPLELLPELNDNSITVLELSSFQLQDFNYAPDYALLLPIFPDHLDYHSSEQDYYKAKRKIFSNSSDTKIVFFEKDREKLAINGLSNQALAYDYDETEDGCFARNDDIICQGQNVFASAGKLCELKQIPLINLVAASSLAWLLKVKVRIQDIEGFTKLPFRVELIGNCAEVEFYNDSASTNPISTLAAIKLFKKPMALIIGGASKQLPIDPLIDEIATNTLIKTVYIFGEVKDELQKKIKISKFRGKLIEKQNLIEIFEELRMDEVELILFSPAFASFDQYKNYKERGEEFSRLFDQLKCKSI